jgi:hypothetical protein
MNMNPARPPPNFVRTARHFQTAALWDRIRTPPTINRFARQEETLEPPENALERRYAQRAVKQRLQQASFREALSRPTTVVVHCLDCRSLCF